MAFVKLDTKILDSTLWEDKPGRDLFLTALLMAIPHVLDEDFPQIKTRSLDYTGFIVPPGRYGFVEAAGVGIIRRAGLEPDPEIWDALDRLGAPESDSRTPDFDGRRLVRIDGGYLVLNFDKYRKKDHTAAERQRRYRAGSNAVTSQSNAVTTRDVTPNDRNVTQAEAEAEAEAEKTTVLDTEFSESIWPIYPKRTGGNNRKKALKAYHTRRKAHDMETIRDGVRRFAACMEAMGKVGTEYVMMAATFLGPDEHFLEAWDPPEVPLTGVQQRLLRELEGLT